MFFKEDGQTASKYVMVYNDSLIGVGATKGRRMCLAKEAEGRVIFFTCNARKRGFSIALSY